MREILFRKDTWTISGEPQPFERTDELRRRFATNSLDLFLEGGAVLESFLGQSIAATLDAEALEGLRPPPAADRPSLEARRRRLTFGSDRPTRTTRAVVVVESTWAEELRSLLGRSSSCRSISGSTSKVTTRCGTTAGAPSSSRPFARRCSAPRSSG